MQTKTKRRDTSLFNRSQRTRLAEIRSSLERHRALGVDVSTWEAEFFLGLIDGFTKRLRRVPASQE